LGSADFSEFYAASYARLLAQVVLVTGDLAEAVARHSA
jgi:hypothetical protein